MFDVSRQGLDNEVNYARRRSIRLLDDCTGYIAMTLEAWGKPSVNTLLVRGTGDHSTTVI